MSQVETPAWVGFYGRAYSGKDTAAELLRPWGYQRVAFADPVRECALALDPVIDLGAPDEPLRLAEYVAGVGWAEAKRHPEVRRTLQRVGTDMGRDVIHPDIWVELATARADQLGTRIAFTDVRFPNEAKAIRAAGGLIIGIRRSAAGIDGNEAGHRSETTSVDVDWWVTNDGTKTELAANLRAILGLELAA